MRYDWAIDLKDHKPSNGAKNPVEHVNAAQRRMVASTESDFSGVAINRSVRPTRWPAVPGQPFGVVFGRQTAILLRLLWQEQIEGLPGCCVHRHEGYRAITVDVIAF